MLGLSNKGLSNREITDYLNSRGIKSPRGTDYTCNLIWVTLKKWREREERLKKRCVKIGKIFVKTDLNKFSAPDDHGTYTEKNLKHYSRLTPMRVADECASIY